MTSAIQTGRPRRRFTVEEYHRMAEVGIIDSDDRVELLEGEVVEMTPIGSRHVGHVMRIQRLMHEQVGDRARVSVQNPLRLDEHSEPEPDVVLLRDREDDYLEQLPTASDALLVIEVTDTSLEEDRQVKLPLYARHEIPIVWLVDLEGQRVDYCSDPHAGSYQTRRTATGSDNLEIPALPKLDVTPADIFG